MSILIDIPSYEITNLSFMRTRAASERYVVRRAVVMDALQGRPQLLQERSLNRYHEFQYGIITRYFLCDGMNFTVMTNST